MRFQRILIFFTPFRCRQDAPISVGHYFNKQDLRRRDLEAATITTLAADAGEPQVPRQRPGFITNERKNMANEAKTSYLHPYQAKVEFLALKETVDKKRRAGYSARAIYTELKSGGHLTMSYSSFSNYIRMAKNDEKAESKPPQRKKAPNGKLH